jgi:leucyl-tRNA synthetase
VMELVNVLYAEEEQLSGPVLSEVIEKIALVLAPFAPYLSQEIWEELGKEGPVFRQPWPEFDAELAKDEGAEVIIQVNGKLRGRFTAPFGTTATELESRAKADEKVQSLLAGKQVVKIITVVDKLVNIVVK